MRQSDKTTRTLVIALLAVLCSGGAPVMAGDGPDTPPTTGVAADLPPIATPPAEASAEVPAGPLATEWASPDAAEALLVTAQVDPAALGPLSIGTPDSGLLLNPVPFPPGRSGRSATRARPGAPRRRSTSSSPRSRRSRPATPARRAS